MAQPVVSTWTIDVSRTPIAATTARQLITLYSAGSYQHGATGDVPDFPPYYLPYFISYRGLTLPPGYEIDTAAGFTSLIPGDGIVTPGVSLVGPRGPEVVYIPGTMNYGAYEGYANTNGIHVRLGNRGMTPDNPGPMTINLVLTLKEAT